MGVGEGGFLLVFFRGIFARRYRGSQKSATLGPYVVYIGSGSTPGPYIVLPDPIYTTAPYGVPIFVSRGSGEQKSPEKPKNPPEKLCSVVSLRG